MKYTILLSLTFVLYVLAQDKLLGERTAKNFPKSWRLGNPAPPSSEITFLIAMKQRNLDVLDERFWAVSTPGSPEYRNFLRIEEINTIVSPDAKDVEKLYKWLSSEGVNTSTIINRGDSLQVRSTVEVASRLFITEFYSFQHSVSGKNIIRQFGKFYVPEPVAPHIDFVSGLSEFPVPKLTLKKTPNSQVTISPQSINSIYKIPDGTKVTGNSSVSVIEWDDQYYSPTELTQFAKLFNVQINVPTAAHTIGFNNPSSPQIEATLDIQYILSVAINAESWFWIEKEGVWLYGFANHFYSTQNVPLICSMSYGWNEEAQCQEGIGDQECQQLGVDSKGYVARVNIEFQKIGLRGISLLSASGDSGANGRTDPYCSEDHLNPPYPAASPFVTAVGGTQITDASGQSNLPNPPPGCDNQACASGGDEVCVSFDQAHYASGGGFSFVAAQPGYQTKAVTTYLSSGVALPPASYYNPTGRGFPDVAALGSAILIYENTIESVGGTSASCPIFAGTMGLLNDYVNTKTGKPLGFLNPFLYEMWSKQPSTFHDITVGDNKCTEGGCSSNCKGFLATTGWDPVSGLGSPVFTEMLAYVQKMFNIKDD